jgi:hypothetical protein
MTVLSQGKFDFEKCSFQGWYYGQVRESSENDWDTEERGEYTSFQFAHDNQEGV